VYIPPQGLHPLLQLHLIIVAAPLFVIADELVGLLDAMELFTLVLGFVGVVFQRELSVGGLDGRRGSVRREAEGSVRVRREVGVHLCRKR